MRVWELLLAVWRAIYVYSEIWIAGRLYMRRWRLMPSWLPGIRLHNILIGDDDRALHDHPFSFVTVILRGGYWEHLIDGSVTWHGPGSVLVRQAEVFHRIELQVDPHSGFHHPAWTLVFRTRYRRQWGFLTKDGWAHNNKFVTKREGKHSDQGGQQ